MALLDALIALKAAHDGCVDNLHEGTAQEALRKASADFEETLKSPEGQRFDIAVGKIADAWEAGTLSLDGPAPFVGSSPAMHLALLEALPVILEQLHPTTVLVQEAWQAAGGNPGIKATREDLLEALRLMDEAEDEAEAQQGVSADASEPGVSQKPKPFKR